MVALNTIRPCPRSVRLTSPRAGTELVLLGKRCPANEAKELGIVDVTSTGSALLSTAQFLAARVLPPNEIVDRQSLTNMKADLYRDVIELFDTNPDHYQALKAKV